MNPLYYINDLEEFVDGARAIIFNNFGVIDNENDIDMFLSKIKPEDKEECDQILSHDESMSIIKQYVKTQKNKKTNNIRYVLDEDIFTTILESLNYRMVSNMLSKMASNGIIESAFDSQLNDFVFWVKDNNETETDRS